jgi:hypothetical protein
VQCWRWLLVPPSWLLRVATKVPLDLLALPVRLAHRARKAPRAKGERRVRREKEAKKVTREPRAKRAIPASRGRTRLRRRPERGNRLATCTIALASIDDRKCPRQIGHRDFRRGFPPPDCVRFEFVEFVLIKAFDILDRPCEGKLGPPKQGLSSNEEGPLLGPGF